MRTRFTARGGGGNHHTRNSLRRAILLHCFDELPERDHLAPSKTGKRNKESQGRCPGTVKLATCGRSFLHACKHQYTLPTYPLGYIIGTDNEEKTLQHRRISLPVIGIFIPKVFRCSLYCLTTVWDLYAGVHPVSPKGQENALFLPKMPIKNFASISLAPEPVEGPVFLQFYDLQVPVLRPGGHSLTT